MTTDKIKDKAPETTVSKMFAAKLASEAGMGVQAYVHTIHKGMRLTAKIVRFTDKKTKKVRLAAMAPSNKVGQDYHPHFGFEDRADADRWGDVALEHFNAK